MDNNEIIVWNNITDLFHFLISQPGWEGSGFIVLIEVIFWQRTDLSRTQDKHECVWVVSSNIASPIPMIADYNRKIYSADLREKSLSSLHDESVVKKFDNQ